MTQTGIGIVIAGCVSLLSGRRVALSKCWQMSLMKRMLKDDFREKGSLGATRVRAPTVYQRLVVQEGNAKVSPFVVCIKSKKFYTLSRVFYGVGILEPIFVFCACLSLVCQIFTYDVAFLHLIKNNINTSLLGGKKREF